MYTEYIIQQSTHSNYSIAIQRDLVLDTAENLTQIGTWARGSFVKDKLRIELFLRLTRKNLNALLDFPVSPSFHSDFHKFCTSFTRLEKEYCSGITNRNTWANGMIAWGTTLTQSVKSI